MYATLYFLMNSFAIKITIPTIIYSIICTFAMKITDFSTALNIGPGDTLELSARTRGGKK